MEAQSEHVHVACTFSHVWAPFRMLSRCLLTKISASELRRKFIMSALLVGEVLLYRKELFFSPSKLSPPYLFFFLLAPHVCKSRVINSGVLTAWGNFFLYPSNHRRRKNWSTLWYGPVQWTPAYCVHGMLCKVLLYPTGMFGQRFQADIPYQQRTLNRLPTELWRKNFVTKAPTEHAARRQACKNVYPTCACSSPSFRFACHRWWLGTL